jgi:hypothetical protein
MTIVTARRPKRKPDQPATIAAPRIVQHTPKGRAWKVREPIEVDPETEARIAAFMARMVRPRD